MMLTESKWNETKEAFLDGLDNRKRAVLNCVFENYKKFQHNTMLVESATMGATASGNIATLNKIMLPLMRRVMPTVIANEILGVQPMTGPVGQINTMRVLYANTSSGVTAGQEALSPFDIARAYSGNEDVLNPGAANTSSMEGRFGNGIKIQIVKDTVEAKTRKLAARYTFEAAQDAQAMHGVDIESEIMAALAQEITAEIDQELINALRLLPSTSVTYDQSAVSGVATFVGDQHAALATLVNYQANLIGQRTRRGAANWAIVSPTVLSLLQSGTTSAFARTTEGTFEAPTNTKLVGVLNSSMRVYVDAYASDSTPMLIGYKGSETDAAGFYCPYVPLTGIGPIIDPQTFEPVVQFMTRYGLKFLQNVQNSFGSASDYVSLINIKANTLSFI